LSFITEWWGLDAQLTGKCGNFLTSESAYFITAITGTCEDFGKFANRKSLTEKTKLDGPRNISGIHYDILFLF
jgi:hypothetical protein